MKHFLVLVQGCYKHMSSKERAQFLESIFSMQNDNFKRIKEELEWFSKKFDYRYKDEPWGNSKDSVARSIKKTAGNARLEGEMKNTGEKKTAIIIGAGPAGITAAYMLIKETDITPIVLEADSMIGGISRTINYKGNRMDLGGHRFFTKSREVSEIWEKFLPAQNENISPDNTDKVMLIRKRSSKIYYNGKFFDYPVSLNWNTLKNMGVGKTITVIFGYFGAVIVKKKEDSLENFYINRFGKPLYKMFFEDYTHKLWGIHPSKLSAEWGAQRVKGLSLMKTAKSMITKKKDVETSLIDKFKYPKYGAYQIWEEMAKYIVSNGGEIYLNTKVTNVHLKDESISSVEVNYEGESYEVSADYYISSMPIKDLFISMGYEVPEYVYKIAADLPYRDFIIAGLLVDKRAFESKHIEDCWIYVQNSNVDVGRIQIFNNWSPYMVKDRENAYWIGLEYFCSEGDRLWNMSEKDFISMAIREAAETGIIKEGYVMDAHIEKVKKAYPSYSGSYSKIDDVKAYLNTIENLYCIGRNGQHRYNNMDHSMLTAIEAVRAIKNQWGKDRIWNVNTEKEYHGEE